MKKFDISNLIISKIWDVYSVNLEEDTEARAKLLHCALIIKRQGSSEYTVSGKTYTADSNNIIFMPMGTEYALEVIKSGECTIIEFDIQNTEKIPVRNSMKLYELAYVSYHNGSCAILQKRV